MIKSILLNYITFPVMLLTVLSQLRYVMKIVFQEL